MVWLKPWPMCSVPVTLGGGSRMQKLSGLASGLVDAGSEVILGFPLGVPAAFDIGRGQSFGEFHGLVGKGETRKLYRSGWPRLRRDLSRAAIAVCVSIMACSARKIAQGRFDDAGHHSRPPGAVRHGGPIRWPVPRAIHGPGRHRISRAGFKDVGLHGGGSSAFQSRLRLSLERLQPPA